MKHVVFLNMVVLVAVLMLIGSEQSYGSENQFSVVSGLATGFDDYRTGFAIHGHYFHAIGKRFGLGIRGGFNKWTSKDPYINYSIVIEIVPSARLYAPVSQKVTLFGQAGVGLWAEKIKAVYGWDNETMGSFELSLGGGMDVLLKEKLSAEILLLNTIWLAQFFPTWNQLMLHSCLFLMLKY